MGVTNVPAVTGGGIKSVQRGSAGGAGDVTITSVDITKSFVTIFGTASSGSAAASGNIVTNASNANSRGTTRNYSTNNNIGGNVSGSLTAGTTNLVTAVVQGFLANSTTLTVSGACRFEIVEFA